MSEPGQAVTETLGIHPRMIDPRARYWDALDVVAELMCKGWPAHVTFDDRPAWVLASQERLEQFERDFAAAAAQVPFEPDPPFVWDVRTAAEGTALVLSAHPRPAGHVTHIVEGIREENDDGHL